MVIVLLFATLAPLLLSGCRSLPTEGQYSSNIGKHPFVLKIKGDSYEFSQFAYGRFPRFSGRCLLIERSKDHEKVLGLTGLTNPPVIFFRVARHPTLLAPGVEFSYDDKMYFDNGWNWLKANPNQASQAIGAEAAPQPER